MHRLPQILHRHLHTSPRRYVAASTAHITPSMPSVFVSKSNWKKQFKTKRDKENKASEVFLLEVQDALELYNRKHHLDLTVQDVSTRALPMNNIQKIEIIYHTSSGDGLGILPVNNQHLVVVVPKTIPGDVADVKIDKFHGMYATGVVVKIFPSRKSPRKDSLIVCKDFNECSGCQLQMLSHDRQLEYKHKMLRRAYQFFYPKLLDEIEDFGFMVESPIQYSYRTKLTPHFGRRNLYRTNPEDVKIGLALHLAPDGYVDIENCPIAVPAINTALPKVRHETRRRIKEFQDRPPGTKTKFNNTLLLRQTTRVNHATGEYETGVVTDQKKIVSEKVGDFLFQFLANDFFQNNPSILPLVLDYIRFHLRDSDVKFKYIIDTYCGSGFFGISLSKDIPDDGRVFGIELAKSSIDYAKHNAKLNGLLEDRVQFLSGNVHDHFQAISPTVSGEESIVIMDPSRKGSDEVFLKQLLDFKPKMIIYVSCNPFSQAQDLALFEKLQKDVKYRVKQVAGFDFFPQTRHVESVAIIERV